MFGKCEFTNDIVGTVAHDERFSPPLSRAMSRDESIYPDPETFNPGRFLKGGGINPEVQDPEKFMSGHGRRCVTKCGFAVDRCFPLYRRPPLLMWAFSAPFVVLALGNILRSGCFSQQSLV